MTRSADTTPDAERALTALYRRLTAAEKTRMAYDMSMAARATTLAGIRRRHPELDDTAAQWALFRVLLGDELFRKVWPAAPLIAA